MDYRERLNLIKLGLAEKTTGPKPKKPLKKVSDKKKQEDKNKAKGRTELDLFFEAMRKKMTGKCLFCGGKTEKSNDETCRNSIAHLLPKRKVEYGGFPSVATNENNWIELCYYGNSCHTNFDNGKITWEFLRDSKEWDVIEQKLLEVLPQVAEQERKNKLYGRLIELIYKKTN